jgi:Peptidase family M28
MMNFGPKSRNAAFSILLAVTVCAQAQVRYRKLSPKTIAQRLAAAGDTQAERGQYLRSEMLSAGCAGKNLTDEVVPQLKQPNIICIIPGKTTKQIIVGAHYDFIAEGRGIVDNWSGAALLPSLIESLSNAPRHHTFVFVAFTGEEEGMLGSKNYVSRLSKDQLEAITAMVNLDTLGLSPTKVWATDSSTPLVDALFKVATTIHSPLTVMNVDEVGTSDNDTFRDAKVPEICIHSVTSQTLPVLHSRNDQMTAIHADEYYETYRLVTAYLATIDAETDKPPAEALKPQVRP